MDIFENSTIASFVSHFESLLDAILDNSSQAINQLTYLSEQDKNLLLSVCDHSNVSYPQQTNVVSLFNQRVLDYPENIALVYQNEELTYAELDAYSNKLAHYLKQKGVRKN